ncbi:hypothetical protein [Aurantiacibacter sp. MUD61]|uniref:hypothetical protein n=1 Tax=Aurantiacibacter sp. MUD61 TaxID=3009083 RepID=UPI0022EFF40F|nr:hypothetical protein [Aurantiacibacter sp. MUD61]
MLLDQQDFEVAFRNSQRFRKNEKAGGRAITRRFKAFASAENVSTREFAQVLLFAYLSRPHKIQISRNSKKYRQDSDKLCRFVMNVTPFRYEKNAEGDEVLSVREEHLVKPLLLQSFLRRKFFSEVELSFLKFGCLEVEYFVSDLPDNWVSHLSKDADFQLACDELNIIQFS